MITNEDIEYAKKEILNMQTSEYERSRGIITIKVEENFNGKNYIGEDWFLLFALKSDNTKTLFYITKSRAGFKKIICPSRGQINNLETLKNVYYELDGDNQLKRNSNNNVNTNSNI